MNFSNGMIKCKSNKRYEFTENVIGRILIENCSNIKIDLCGFKLIDPCLTNIVYKEPYTLVNVLHCDGITIKNGHILYKPHKQMSIPVLYSHCKCMLLSGLNVEAKLTKTQKRNRRNKKINCRK